MNSTLVPGSPSSISERISAMTSSNAAVAVLLELDGEVPAVGFCYRRKSQLQTGSPRGIFNFRCWCRTSSMRRRIRLDSAKRTSRRGEIIQDESTLIHFRQQIATQKLIAHYGKDHDGNRTRHQHQRARQHRPHDPPVEINDSTEKSREMRFFSGQKGIHIRRLGSIRLSTAVSLRRTRY